MGFFYIDFWVLHLILQSVVYKKLFGGKKSLTKKQLLLWGLFIGYVIMVFGVTFLNRGLNHGGLDLSFFGLYREAWYSFDVRNWQFVYLNILMFVPFGILFPLLHPPFQKAKWTIGMAAFFTLSIESVQLITRYGSFVVDTLFNNLLGAIIGYGMIMGFIKIKERELRRSFFYFSPLLLVVILFGSMFTYYYLKEFENLSIMPNQKTNMANVIITLDVQLDDHVNTVPVYRAPNYTKASADKFVKDFSTRIQLDTSKMEVIYYQNEGVYWIGENRSHNICFQNLDGSYSYTDFSSSNEDKEPQDVDEGALKGKLTKFGIDIPQDAHFQKVETGTYKWTLDKKVRGNQLIDGSLLASYNKDNTVKRIENQIITYDKVRDVQIKSEQEAYKEILDGEFKYYSENKMIKTLHIHKIEVSYYLDSKGYYQPVYAFHSTVDGTDNIILIPGF